MQEMQKVESIWRVGSGVFLATTRKEDLELRELLCRMELKLDPLDPRDFSHLDNKNNEAAVACHDCAGIVRWIVYIKRSSDHEQNEAEVVKWIQRFQEQSETFRIMNRTLETLEGVLVIVPSS